MPFVSVGPLINDAAAARIATLLPAVPVRYRGDQAADPNYILFLHDDERLARGWTNKDADSNDYVLVLQLWAEKARTNMSRAKTIIDSFAASPLSIAGWSFLRLEVEQNRNMPDLPKDGQRNQYARLLQIRMFYYPSP